MYEDEDICMPLSLSVIAQLEDRGAELIGQYYVPMYYIPVGRYDAVAFCFCILGPRV